MRQQRNTGYHLLTKSNLNPLLVGEIFVFQKDVYLAKNAPHVQILQIFNNESKTEGN